MAVGKIEYKKILKDEDLTPTKLKDLYVSSLKNNDDSFGGYEDDFANDPTKRYTIMTPETAAALIANRQQNSSSTKDSKDSKDQTDEKIKEEVVEETQPQKSHDPIQGGIWPIVTDFDWNRSNNNSSQMTFSNESDFVQQMTNAYAAELRRRGYNPAFAEYLVAQDALESGWGEHQAGKNNFGGIKLVGTGSGSVEKTKEWNGYKMEEVSDSFRNFDSLQDYINYKINLVGNKNYNVFAYSPNQFFNRMKAGGYATDPDYINKLNQTLQLVRNYS